MNDANITLGAGKPVQYIDPPVKKDIELSHEH